MLYSGHKLGHKKIVITYEEFFFNRKCDMKVLREVLESLRDGKNLNWKRS